MMARKLYGSNPDGTIGEEIQSGEVGNFFPVLSTTERQNGDDKKVKVWLESTIDETVYLTIHRDSNYEDCVFESANDGDTEDDLTGDEARYGTMRIAALSTTADEVIIANDRPWTMVRVGDKIIIGGDIYTVDNITDNGDGTLTVSVDTDIATAVQIDDLVRTIIVKDLTANTPTPFWVEEKVLAGSPRFAAYETVYYGLYY